MNKAEREWRTLMVATVALAYPAGQTGFQLGAYGELLFQHRLIGLIAVTATLLVFLILPKQFMPMPRWHIWFLAIPSLWMIGRLAIGASVASVVVHPIVFAIGIVSFLLCFPYALYLIVCIANPDLTEIRGLRHWSILAAIACTFFLLGYLLGNWNEYFISCQEARIGRIEPPAHCQ